MACDHEHACPACGDRMIHQENRGWNESSSAFGQFIHDEFPTKFWFMDVDGVVLRREDDEGCDGSLRIFEIKKPGGKLSGGQNVLLPILARAVYATAPDAGFPDSGVFCLHWSPGEHAATVTRFLPTGRRKTFTVEGEQFRRLVTGLPSLEREEQKKQDQGRAAA